MGQPTTPTKKKTKKGYCLHCGKRSHHRFIVCRHCGKRVALDPALYRQATVVSYPKSGRTWLSFLLCHYTLTHFRATDLDYGFTYKPELRTQYQELLLRKGKRRRYPIVAFAHGVPRDRSFSVRLRQARTRRAQAGLPGALIGTVKTVDGPPARFLSNPMGYFSAIRGKWSSAITIICERRQTWSTSPSRPSFVTNSEGSARFSAT